MADTDTALAGQNATQSDVLDMHALQLLGVMQAHDGPAALLRSAQGDIARLQIGEEAFGIRVTAIGETEIILTNRWGQSESLALPQG